MSTNALPKQTVVTLQLDLPEMPLTAVDAKTATSQERFQIKLELHVSSDHLLNATVDKEESTKVMLALIAHLDKLLTQLTQTDV